MHDGKRLTVHVRACVTRSLHFRGPKKVSLRRILCRVSRCGDMRSFSYRFDRFDMLPVTCRSNIPSHPKYCPPCALGRGALGLKHFTLPPSLHYRLNNKCFGLETCPNSIPFDCRTACCAGRGWPYPQDTWTNTTRPSETSEQRVKRKLFDKLPHES